LGATTELGIVVETSVCCSMFVETCPALIVVFGGGNGKGGGFLSSPGVLGDDISEGSKE